MPSMVGVSICSNIASLQKKTGDFIRNNSEESSSEDKSKKNVSEDKANADDSAAVQVVIKYVFVSNSV